MHPAPFALCNQHVAAAGHGGQQTATTSGGRPQSSPATRSPINVTSRHIIAGIRISYPLMQGVFGGRWGKPVAALLLGTVLALGLTACDSGQHVPSSSSSTPSPAPVKTKEIPAGSYHLQADGRAIVVKPNHEQIPVISKSVTGYIGSATPEGKIISLTGWAAPADLSRPADQVVAFVGEKAVTAVIPSVERSDVADGYNKPNLLHSGFAITIPVSSLDCQAPMQGLQIFGISDGVATSVEWLVETRKLVAQTCPK